MPQPQRRTRKRRIELWAALLGRRTAGQSLLRPLEGAFDLRFGLGYLDTEITNSVVDGVATGSELPNAPEFTFSSMASYEWPISGSLTAEVAVAADFQDNVTFDIVRAPPQAIEGSYWLYDARIVVRIARRG